MLYDAVPATELGEAGDALRQAALDGVLLYSPRTARIWRGLIERAGLQNDAAGFAISACPAMLPQCFPKLGQHKWQSGPKEGAMLALLEQTRRTL